MSPIRHATTRFAPSIDRRPTRGRPPAGGAPAGAARTNRCWAFCSSPVAREHRSTQFDRLLFGNHCQHAAVALDRVRRIEALDRRRSFQASLQVAREIQRGFMPNRMPPISGYEAATWWMANEAVGGDYCDVIRLKDHRVALTIADVSGHGLGPSLIMATVRAALHALVLEHTEPEVLLNLLGRSLSQDLSDERFITMAAWCTRSG